MVNVGRANTKRVGASSMSENRSCGGGERKEIEIGRRRRKERSEVAAGLWRRSEKSMPLRAAPSIHRIHNNASSFKTGRAADHFHHMATTFHPVRSKSQEGERGTCT